MGSVKYTIDLPILKDNDPEVEIHIEECDSQFAHRNFEKTVFSPFLFKNDEKSSKKCVFLRCSL